MEIAIGKYVITSDSMNVVLNEKKVRKEGKSKGEPYLETVAFYSSVEACLKGILDKQIMMSKATSIEELLKEIKDAKKFIQNEFKKARGEDKK